MYEHFEGPFGQPECNGSTAATVSITLHLFPLPYHHNAYFLAQAAQAIGRSANSSQIWTWMEAVFANQGEFGNAATESMTAAQVKSKCADLAETAGIERDVVSKGLNDEQMDGNTRFGWKYACYRGVFGTPTFFVNQVPAPAEAAGWSAKQWITFVNTLQGRTTFSTFLDSDTKLY